VTLAREPQTRTYEETHPWITFRFDLNSLNQVDWMHVGEALSKCDHISGVPLKPEIARELHKVYLAKGVHATTQIEGNTLSEDEVRRRVDGELSLPDSQEYLGIEIDNILAACDTIAGDLMVDNDLTLTVDRVKSFNRLVLDSLPSREGVVPGAIRTDSAVVGSVYRGAPWQDCEYLLERLCSWLEDMVEEAPDQWRRPVKLIRAILAHLYLAWIHPFGDGNGRTARLVEFQLLADAGFPTPACHLLSNYYNRTRSRYYQVLAETSQPPYPVDRLVSYALRGFVEELREQLGVIRDYVLVVSWTNYVHEQFTGQHGSTAKRRRDVVLALPWHQDTPSNKIRGLSPEVQEQYVQKQQKTVSRDVNAIVKLGLVRRTPRGIRPHVDVLNALLPVRHNDG
jgi:Fic family protein